jgi:hypothetical protein
MRTIEDITPDEVLELAKMHSVLLCDGCRHWVRFSNLENTATCLCEKSPLYSKPVNRQCGCAEWKPIERSEDK